MKKQYAVTVAGIDMHVVSENEADRVTKLVSELNQRITAFQLSCANVTREEAIAICALDLLDENARLKQAKAEAVKKSDREN